MAGALVAGAFVAPASAAAQEQDPIGPVVAPVCAVPNNLSYLVVTLSLLAGIPAEQLGAALAPLYAACAAFPVPSHRTTCDPDRALDAAAAPVTGELPVDPLVPPVGALTDALRGVVGDAADPLADALGCETVPLAPPLDGEPGGDVDAAPAVGGGPPPGVPGAPGDAPAAVQPGAVGTAAPAGSSPPPDNGAGDDRTPVALEPTVRSVASRDVPRWLGIALLAAAGAAAARRVTRPATDRDEVRGVGRLRRPRNGTVPRL